MLSRLLVLLSRLLFGAYPRWVGVAPEARQRRVFQALPSSSSARGPIPGGRRVTWSMGLSVSKPGCTE